MGKFANGIKFMELFIYVHPVAHRGSAEVTTLRRNLPPRVKFSTFDIISACLWRSYAIALRLDPKDEVRLAFLVNTRTVVNPPIPPGYNGNVNAFALAYTTADQLCNNPITYALSLVRKAKSEITHEHMMSLADFMVLKGKPHFVGDYRTIAIFDVSRDLQFVHFDKGWG
ncbi:Benzyl alcohol O-benzoyltransferase [Bienertia sinuspersici]